MAARPRRWLGRRVLVHVGPLAISSYAAFLYLGCVAGALAGTAVAVASGIDGWRYMLSAVALLVPALVGARLWYVLQNWARYRIEPSRLLRRSEGGAGLYGGLVMALLLSPLLLHWARVPFLGFWDASAINMLVGLAVTRLGCFMNGCCCGRESHAWYAWTLPDHRGTWKRRVPTQLLEALAALLLLPALLAFRPHLASGALFAAAAFAYGLLRFALEATRESFVLQPGQRTDRQFSLLLAAGALVLGWVVSR